MAYEVSSSIAAGNVVGTWVQARASTSTLGGTPSPNGAKIAGISYRHGGAGSTDYGIDIWTSSSANGWEESESIDTGASSSDLPRYLTWYNDNQIFGVTTGNKLKTYTSASSGWSIAELGSVNSSGTEMKWNPAKTKLAIVDSFQAYSATNLDDDEEMDVYVSSSGDWTRVNFNTVALEPNGRVTGVTWVDDDNMIVGQPNPDNDNQGRIVHYSFDDTTATLVRNCDGFNGSQGVKNLGWMVHWHSGSNGGDGTLLVGGYTSAGYASLNLIPSQSTGYIPASNPHSAPGRELLEIDPVGSTDGGEGNVRALRGMTFNADPANGDRIFGRTISKNGSPYDDVTYMIMETGSDGWKFSELEDNAIGTSVNLGGLPIGAPYYVGWTTGSTSTYGFTVYENIIAANPALDDSSTETVGTSGGTISVGGTTNTPDASVQFPANAFSTNRSVTVELSDDNDPKTLDAESSGGSFSQPASKVLSVTIPAAAGTLASAATVTLSLLTGADTSKTVLLKRFGASSPWFIVPSNLYTVDSGENNITFTTTRFSDYLAVEDENMARTKLNNTQLSKILDSNKVGARSLDITGSAGLTGSLAGDMMFVVQKDGDTPTKILASEMQDYFSSVDVTSTAGDVAIKLVMASSSGGSLFVDSNSLTFTPSTNLLTVGGSIIVGNTSTIGNAAVTDLITFNADGDIVIKNGTYDFDIASHDGTNGFKLGGTLITADATEINKLDGVTATTTELNYVDVTTAGTVEASKAVVVDGNKDATGFRNVSGTGTITAFTALSGSKLVVGSADMSEADLEKLDGITDGTVAANKAVVVDSNKDASSFRNLTATGAVTAGSLVIGSADINEAELETIDGVTAGTVAASKAVVVDSNKDIAGFRDVTIAGTGSIAGDLVITGNLQVDGSQTIINTTHLEVADKTLLIASGSANAAAADGAGIVVEDIAGDDKSILFQNTGTNFKSSENFDIASGKVYKINNTEVLSATALTIGSAAMSEADLEKLDDITNGTVAASKAVVVDANKDAAGFRNLSASTNVSASAFYGDGSNLTGVGAEVSTSAANTEFKLSFVTDAAADAASLLIDSTAHGTYNPSANRIGLAEVSSSANLQLRAGKTDDVLVGDNDTTGDVVLFAKGGTIGNSTGFILSGSDNKALFTLVGDGSNNNKLQIEAGGSIAEINAAAALTMKAANGAATVTAVGANAVLQRQTGAKVTTTDTTVQIDTPSGAGRTIEFHNNGFKAGELEVYTDSGNADKIALKTAGVNGLSLSASAGTIGISGSHGIQLASVNDTVIDLAADSLYFKDADGKVKSDTIADIMGLVAGTVTATGIADSSGVLSLAIHSLDAEVIATGDKIAFSDAGDNGLHSETVDDLFKIGPALVTEAAADVADDYILFLDGGASGEAKKESVSDLVGSLTGDGLTATNGVIAVDVVEKHFFSASSNTGAASGMSTNLVTASLNVGSEGNVLADSLQVFLNGMLQTVSSSAGHTSATGVFDYEVSGASGYGSTTPTAVVLQGALDADDVLVVRYLKK